MEQWVDYGYGLFRLSNDLPWRPKNRYQIISYALLSLLFEWGVAYHELAAGVFPSVGVCAAG